MIGVTEKNDVNSELLNDPQKLLNNYYKLVESISNVVNVINEQMGFGKKEAENYIERLKNHKKLISRMLQIQQKEIKHFEDCIALCDEKIALGDDIDGTYRKKKRSLERLRQDDKKLLVQLQLGVREYNKSIAELQKMYMEE